MAQRRRRKRNWIKTFLVYLLVPPFVWIVAFLIWLYWYDLRDPFITKAKEPADRLKAARQVDKGDKAPRPPAKRSAENIFDDERRKLDDIIKRQ
jgi:hypothetical protein